MSCTSRITTWSVLAAALGGVLLAPARARADDFPLQVKPYGFLNAQLEWVRALGGTTPYTPRMRVSDCNSRLGLAGSLAVNDDLKVVVQLEGFLNNFEQGGIDDLGHPSTLESRNSFVGVDHRRFGRLLVGYMDSPYRSLVGTGNEYGGNLGLTQLGLDLWNNTTASMSGGFPSLFSRGEARFKNSVHYTSPELFGVRLSAAYGFDETLSNGGRRDRVSVALSYNLLGLKAGIAFDHQANTGVDGDSLQRGLGFQTTGVNDVATNYYKVFASYLFPTNTYVGFGYERSVYGYANFAQIDPGQIYTPLDQGTMSQGGAMLSIAQGLGDLTFMFSVGKLGNLSNSIEGSGSDYGASQLSIGAKYAFNGAFMAYVFFSRIDNKPLQNLQLGSPIFSNQTGTDGAYLSPGDKPTAGGIGMIARF
ncbi:MAG: porin [Deltaproteobacteria bacterium]|nr:porin [Deltaproteobacteria bacterium]